jgi:hypothetical protein
MPSLNQRHRASELLREAARLRLQREAAARASASMAEEKPVLHLFKSGNGTHEATEAQQAVGAGDRPRRSSRARSCS